MADSFGTAQSWNQWRSERDAALAEPYGWFSVVGLDWLDATPRVLDHFPGEWSASIDGNVVVAEIPVDQPLYRDGEEITGTLEIPIEPGAVDRSLRDGRGREAELMHRFGRLGIRVRDPQSPMLASDFRVSRYKFSPKWALRGRLLPYPEPREIIVDAASKGDQHALTAWGEAEVALPNDEVVRLAVTGDRLENASVLFYDETNGDKTAAWRNAPIAVDGQTVVIDFNRAAILPAHMTPYGTCPKPPAGNVVNAKVKAGEKKVEKP